MKPNELRIGNIVKRGSYFSVERKFNNHVREEFNEANVIVDINVLKDIEFGIFSGIPITEEWLLKFGFENKSNFKYSDGSKDWVDIYLLDNYMVKYIGNNDYGLCQMKLNNIEAVLHTDLKHIHQLQNLCFALTGKELEIKSPQQTVKG